MKTRADLLLRDALAASFVAACAEDAEARGRIEALGAWAAGRPLSPDARAHLSALRAENERALFGPDGELCAEFATLAPYARDRALRFSAALGWLRADQGDGDPLRAARAAWDAGLFFEVHELLEPVWLRAEGVRKTALQGLILAGAGLHHLVGANRAGAAALLRDSARKLTESPCLDGADLAAFGRGMAELAARIADGRVASAADVADLPRF
jgi:hypothetical protein